MIKKASIARQASAIRKKMKRQGIKFLCDWQGKEVPLDYVPNLDLIKHYYAKQFLEKADKLNQELALFKAEVQQTGDDLFEQLQAENNIKSTSIGGFTVATFDKDQKIQYKMDLQTTYDEDLMRIAHSMKEEYRKDIIEKTGDNELGIILDWAFETTNGKLDVRRLTSLNKYRSKVKNSHFRKMVDTINKALNVNHTKRFEIFEQRDSQGEYKTINLSYARVDPQ